MANTIFYKVRKGEFLFISMHSFELYFLFHIFG